MSQEIELVVDQKLENTSRKTESTTWILVPVNKDKIKAKRIKLQVTETPASPCDFGKIGLTDVVTIQITKTNRQCTLDEEEEDEDE